MNMDSDMAVPSVVTTESKIPPSLEFAFSLSLFFLNRVGIGK